MSITLNDKINTSVTIFCNKQEANGHNDINITTVWALRGRYVVSAIVDGVPKSKSITTRVANVTALVIQEANKGTNKENKENKEN